MNELFDILLSKPLSQDLNNALMFVTFVFHILFVLFAVGTAVIGVAYFVAGRWGSNTRSGRWAGEIIHSLLAHKTLLVAIGVAPLLLIQVGYTVPFFTALNLLAPFWLLVIPLVIVAFLALEALGERDAARRRWSLWLMLIGLSLLLVLPAIFVAVLTLTENADQWLATVRSGYRLPQPIAFHWLVRYLHVLGAAIVFGAAYHFLSSGPEDTEKRRSLMRWIAGGAVAQIILGALLYISLPRAMDQVMYIPFVVGVAGALALLWLAVVRPASLPWQSVTNFTVLLVLILLPMLATRQLIQNRDVIPAEQQSESAAQQYNARLADLAQPALAGYSANLQVVYDNGQTIYAYSCGFCHNEFLGNPPVASNRLAVPPEWLTMVRARRPYLDRVVAGGVPGSAMPYFTVFTKDKLDEVITYLDGQYHILSAPGPLPREIPDSAVQQAKATYSSACASCHGADGKGGTAAAQAFQPPVPDFTAYNMTPERAFDVITNGYPGTAMTPYGQLAEDERWGLVALVNGFFVE